MNNIAAMVAKAVKEEMVAISYPPLALYFLVAMAAKVPMAVMAAIQP